jgi:peptidoglycan hydrolase-like protein with peptidoglycan-binding domain
MNRSSFLPGSLSSSGSPNSPKEWELFFESVNVRPSASSFGVDPNVLAFARTAAQGLVATGWQDPGTQGLVRAWQSAHGSGLQADGKYGPMSQRALAADLGEPAPPAYAAKGQAPKGATYMPGVDLSAPQAFSPSPLTPTPFVETPATAGSASVKMIAPLAQAAEDAILAQGWKNAATQAALRAWQQAHGGIKVDGIYGPTSATALAMDLNGPSLPPYFIPQNMSAAPAPQRSQGAAALVPPTPPAGHPAGPVPTHLNRSQSEIVQLGQAALALLLTKGWQDAATRAAVLSWQTARGGPELDGKYGPHSAAALGADLGSIVPGPYYLPKPGAAHPELEQVVADKAKAFPWTKFGTGVVIIGGSAFLAKTLVEWWSNRQTPPTLRSAHSGHATFRHAAPHHA